MAIEYKDRVCDTSLTTGTGALTLTGASPVGFRPFSAHSNGATIRYAIEGAGGAQWEVGEGVWDSGASTLTRTTVFASSNAGALVGFTDVPLKVISTMTAADAVDAVASAVIDKASVYRTAALTTTSSAWQKLAFDSVLFDVGGIWDSTNKRFVPKNPGYYTVHGRIRVASNTTLVCSVFKNGGSHSTLGADSTLIATGGSAIVYCNGTTDYLELFAYVGSAVALTVGSSHTYFQIMGPM